MSTSENIEGFNPQYLADAEVTGDGGDNDNHYQRQSEIPKRDHRCIIREPHLGERDGESAQSDS
jgi:hypothetical protein